MRFAAYLALIGAAAAVKMVEVPQDNALLDLDEEVLQDLMEQEAAGKCADPGIQAAIDFWQGKLDAGKNWTWIFPTFKTWATKKCVEAGVNEANCPTEADL